MLLLGGLCLRLQREIEVAQARADATDALVHRQVQQDRGESAESWLSGPRSGDARLVECALKVAASAGAAPSELSIADGVAGVMFARDLPPALLERLPPGVTQATDGTGNLSPRQLLVQSGACR